MTEPNPRRPSNALRTRVAIIGGGPVGLAVARELELHGIDCIVVEPRTTVSHSRPRAKTTTARTMELFRRWGLADDIRARAPIAPAWSSDIVFCTTVTGREITRFTDALGLTLDSTGVVCEGGQQVAQPVVEEALRDSLRDSPSVSLLFGWRATAVVQRADAAEVRILNEAGDCQTIVADYVVGADGPRSVVRAAMDAHYVGVDNGRPNLNIVFRSRELRALIPHGPALHYWALNHQAPGVIGPLDLDDLWWAISTGRPADDAEADPVSIVRALAGHDIDVEVVETDPWQARSLVADRYRSDRLFIVGDAAHQNPPWGGHGFNTGVGDALNLGWKLAATLNGWGPPELLDSYESERRPIVEQTIVIASENTKTLPSDFTVPELMGSQAEFDAVQPAVAARIQLSKRIEFHSLGLVLGYGYTPDSSQQTTDMTDYLPLCASGNRLPHHWLSPGVSLFDALGPDFTVIARNHSAHDLIAELRSRGVPVVELDDARADPRALFGCEVVLVRPDQHIAWCGDIQQPADASRTATAALAGFGAHPAVPVSVPVSVAATHEYHAN